VKYKTEMNKTNLICWNGS